MIVQRAAAIASLAVSCFAQNQTGAKALFMDPTSGVSIQSSAGQKKSEPPVKRAGQPSLPGNTGQKVSVEMPDATGVAYWLELVTEKGELLQVSSNRVFRSGERVRLYVRSNVDGDLTILQSQDGSPFSMLFPNARNPTATVKAREDSVFPSRTGWFRFDQRPGAMKLLLMVRASGQAAPVQTARNTPPVPVTTTTTTAPPTTTEPRSTTQQPQKQAPKPASADLDYEAEVKRQLDKLRGSKGLVVEDDTTPNSEVRYVVADRRRDPSIDPGVVALEISLVHQAK